MSIILNKGITLITGPSRSGKSLIAEKLLKDKKNVYYIATGIKKNDDNLWNERILKHLNRRPEEWETIEENKNLDFLISQIKPNKFLLIDSLGGFVSAYLDYNEEDWNLIKYKFIDSIVKYQGYILIVIEQVGWGLVSDYELGNLFRDRIGLISQEIEVLSIDSWLIIQGRAIDLKKISINLL